MKRCTHRLSVSLAITCAAALAGISVIRAETYKTNAFDQCAVCHSIDGTNGTGPSLRGIFGRQSGSLPGFRYSRAMRSAGITWDAKMLEQYLSNPQELVPGNIMPFSGIADSAERAAVIAYLQSLK